MVALTFDEFLSYDVILLEQDVATAIEFHLLINIPMLNILSSYHNFHFSSLSYCGFLQNTFHEHNLRAYLHIKVYLVFVTFVMEAIEASVPQS